MLQFITNGVSGLAHIEGAKAALEGGCTWIQLRMKDTPSHEILATALRLRELCDGYGATLIIDDHVELVIAAKAHGVHLGKMDTSPAQAREILGDHFIIGGTANTWEDMERLVEQGVNYIGLGPFRYTTTKKNLSPILGLEGYAAVMKKCREQRINTPTVAIGGITKEDIAELLRTGVTGIALSGTILQALNPQAATKEIMNIIKQHKNE